MKVKTRYILPEETELCRKFIQFLNSILWYNDIRYKNEQSILGLEESIKQFSKFAFAQDTIDRINVFKRQMHTNRIKQQGLINKLQVSKKHLDEAIDDFVNGNMNFKVVPVNFEFHSMKPPATFLQYSGAAAFFSGGKTKDLLHSFTKDEMLSVAEANLERRTALNINDQMDWQHIVFFIQHLTRDEVYKVDDVAKWLLFDKDSVRSDLIDLIEHYQYSNVKSNIPKIVSLIESDSILKSINNRVKSFKTLYRGIASDELLPTEDIIAEDRKTKYVSTTPHESVAQRFAERRGHLDNNANSKYSYLITYKTNPHSILFSTELVGVVYGESDIVIDTTLVSDVTVRRIR